MSIAAGLLVLTLQLPVGTEFFPQNERDQFAVEVWLPEHSSIEQTDAAARRVEQMIQAISTTTDAAGREVQRLRAMRTVVGGGRIPVVPFLESAAAQAQLRRDPRANDGRTLHARLCAANS